MKIPFLDLSRAFGDISDEVFEAITPLLKSGQYIGGPEVAAFEEEFAAYCEADYCAGVDNGTSAILLILKALNIGNGDEVIIPANTFAATLEAIVHAGAKPVLVDMDPVTYTIDPTTIEAAISSDTKAIIAVHLYGQPSDMEPILEIAKRNELRVIEDAAQAHGATYNGRRVGSFGDAAAFSFYPGKNLGACGDGGAVVSNNAELIDTIKMLREHGTKEKYVHELVGDTARLDAVQAAILRIKLRALDSKNNNRRMIANQYREGLADQSDWLKLPVVREASESSWHLFVIHCEQRDELKAYLESSGVECGLHYPKPLHIQEGFKNHVRISGSVDASEKSCETLLSLPIYPEMDNHQIETVINTVKAFSGS